jgi:hypothetical protein
MVIDWILGLSNVCHVHSSIRNEPQPFMVCHHIMNQALAGPDQLLTVMHHHFLPQLLVIISAPLIVP